MKHKLWISIGFALLCAGAFSAADSAPQQRVRVSTNMGDFVIELYQDRAPITVTNFLRYVNEGFYSGTLFHRVIANFVIQGGGHATDYKIKPTHEPIFNESGNGIMNKRTMVGMARGDGAYTGNSQFYVDLADNSDLDPVPTRWGYAVFGHVVEGMDVVDRIAVVPTGAIGPFKSEAPLKPVIIEKMTLLPADGGDASSPTAKSPLGAMPAGDSPGAPPASSPPPH